MPELPEVETIRRQLKKLIVGKTISSIEVLNPASFRADAATLIGKSITNVSRKGKILILDLACVSPKRTLLAGRQGESLKDKARLFVHLKMSGQLKFLAAVKRFNLAAARLNLNRYKHLRVCLNLDNGGRLLFSDQRKFGWISDDPAALPRGIDALSPRLTSKILAGILSSSTRPIKQILTDQSKIAGIGNIYASEILWQAKISPLRKFQKGCTLPRQGATLMHTAIRQVLTEAIAAGGSTMNDGLYRRVGGEAGDYWSRRRVYASAGQPCPRLACRKKNALIQKITISGRSTYFCPSCQR